MTEKLEAIQTIFRDFEADQRDGFVSNVYSYVESRCQELGIPSLTDEVYTLLTRAI